MGMLITVYKPCLLHIKLINEQIIIINNKDINDPFEPQRLNPELDVSTKNEMDMVDLASGLAEKYLYRLYNLLSPTLVYNWNRGLWVVTGEVPDIGKSSGFCFFMDDVKSGYQTLAHELGHLLGLRHPNDESNVGQYPDYFLKPKDVGDANILPDSDDPWNLMGYKGNLIERGLYTKYLRYQQWKTAYRYAYVKTAVIE